MNFLKSCKMRFGKPNEVVRRSQFRTFYNKTSYRLFAFWDKQNKEDTLVIATHGLVKKTDKIPKIEIENAEKLRIKYFIEKK